MYRGWYQVAYERELTQELTPLSIGGLELLAVRSAGSFRIFSAFCPHRGAHLGWGGRLDGDAVVCPFHGRRIGLVSPGDDGFCLRSYRTLAAGGLLFVLLDDGLDQGFAAFLEGLDATHYLIPGFTLKVRTLPEYVIENALDQRHFSQVHGVSEIPELEVLESQHGELAVRARLSTPRPNPWQEETAQGVDLRLRIFSPNLCVTEMADGGHPRFVLTAATPEPSGECRIQVSLAVPAGHGGAPPDQESVRALLRDSRAAIEQDAEVWKHLAPGGSPVRRDRFVPGDALVAEYYEFCQQFRRPQPAA